MPTKMITAKIFELPCKSIIAMWNDYDQLTFADVTDCELRGTEKEEVEYDSNEGIGLVKDQSFDYCIKASDYIPKKNMYLPDYPLHKFMLEIAEQECFKSFTMQDLDTLDYDKADFLKAVVNELWKISMKEFEDIRL